MERRALERLQALIENDVQRRNSWRVCGMFPVENHQGMSEIDMCVLIPNKGVLILEYKSWDTAQYETDGVFTLNNGETKNPYQQVHRQRRALQEFIETSEYHTEARYAIPFIVGNVWLGEMNREFFEQEDGPRLEGPREALTIFRNHMAVDAEINFLDFLERRFDEGCMFERRFEQSRVDRLYELLVGNEGFCGPDEDYLRREDERIRDEETSLGIDPNIHPDYKKAYITGSAGTGKTHFALRLAEERAQRARDVGLAERQSLYVCFSQQLADALRAERRDIEREGLVQILTPREILEEFAPEVHQAVVEEDEQRRASGLPVRSKNHIPDDALEHLEELLLQEDHPRFAAVCVDEAQDIRWGVIQTLELLVDSSFDDHIFAIFEDERQHTRPDLHRGEDEELARQRFTGAGTYRHALRRNFRNAPNIIPRIESTGRADYSPVKGGAQPGVVLEDANSQTKTDVVVRALALAEDWVRQGEDLSHLVIILTLFNSTEVRDLREKFQEISADLNVQTVDEFKGLEADWVLVIVGDHEPNAHDCQSLIYTAISRPRRRLDVVLTKAASERYLVNDIPEVA